MKIVIAPDSFKGNMRSPVVCDIIRRGLLSVLPDARVVAIPVADGGEGTTEAAVSATNGTFESVEVSDPLGRPVTAQFGILGNSRTAVMEMACASGLELLAPDELNPLKTTTYGTGQVIRAILDHGIRDIIIGIGGSATVDGGAGMAQALGYAFLDADGHDAPQGGGFLDRICKIRTEDADPRLRQARIRVACDVTNPLLGPNGAATVYGPQKGATPSMCHELENGLSNLADVWRRTGLLDHTDRPGDGAAGGLGAGLRAFCGAEMVSGAELVIEITGLEEHMADADLVITGEGRTDSQTASGKLCAVVAESARAVGVPVVLLSGALAGDLPALLEPFDAALSISAGHGSLDACIAASHDDLFFTAQNVARLYTLSNRTG